MIGTGSAVRSGLLMFQIRERAGTRSVVFRFGSPCAHTAIRSKQTLARNAAGAQVSLGGDLGSPEGAGAPDGCDINYRTLAAGADASRRRRKEHGITS